MVVSVPWAGGSPGVLPQGVGPVAVRQCLRGEGECQDKERGRFKQGAFQRLKWLLGVGQARRSRW
eukprot:11197982-Lingulodinium_polyedra.AAC.1